MEDPLLACPRCGQIQRRIPHDEREHLRCCRCGARLTGGLSAWWPMCFATVAFIAFWPGVLLPIMRVERLGLSHEASVVDGIVVLAQHGNLALALLIALCSVFLPLLKLGGLLVLLVPRLWHGLGSAKRQRHLLEAIEWSGRWGMVDVLLVAIFVAFLKLGDLVLVDIGTGLFAFVAMVVSSMAASLSLNAEQLWSKHEH